MLQKMLLLRCLTIFKGKITKSIELFLKKVMMKMEFTWFRKEALNYGWKKIIEE